MCVCVLCMTVQACIMCVSELTGRTRSFGPCVATQIREEQTACIRDVKKKKAKKGSNEFGAK